jgi:hypothetical protein
VEQVDSLVSARLDNGLEQQGVLTMVKGDAPSMLVLLFPGEPSVLKAEIVESKLMKTRVGGNPLVRARSLLVRPGVGTVLIDCRSDQEEQCKESYVMSKDRFEDVRKLTSQLRQALPGVKKIWLVGHSFGSLASASLARYGDSVFDGAIHVSPRSVPGDSVFSSGIRGCQVQGCARSHFRRKRNARRSVRAVFGARLCGRRTRIDADDFRCRRTRC